MACTTWPSRVARASGRVELVAEDGVTRAAVREAHVHALPLPYGKICSILHEAGYPPIMGGDHVKQEATVRAR